MKLFYCLLLVVFLSPFPYAANMPWAWSLCALFISVTGIIWAIQQLFFSTQYFTTLFKSISDIVIVFFVVVCWTLIQTSSFFPDLHHPLWHIADAGSGFISLTPADGLISIMRLISYALVFWLALFYSQDVYKARLIFYGLMVAGFIYSAYGLIIYLGNSKMILWRETPGLSSVSSTFVNHNHFATFAGLTLLCSLALIHDAATVSARYNRGGNIGWQRFIESLITRTWFPLLAFIVIGTALILTHSRGGFFSSLLGLSVLLLALNSNGKTRNVYILWSFIIFITVGGIVFYISSDGLLASLDKQGLSDPLRELNYQLTWTAILTNPWLGFGFGSFEEVFPLYKTMEMAGPFTQPYLIDYAHNTYLETIFELGFPAAMALFYCFLRLASICFMGLFVRKKDWFYPAVGLGATGLIATHACVDFSMQIPAIPYTYALLMGAACAQSFSSKNSSL
jgi:O-antigen ligase